MLTGIREPLCPSQCTVFTRNNNYIKLKCAAWSGFWSEKVNGQRCYLNCTFPWCILGLMYLNDKLSPKIRPALHIAVDGRSEQARYQPAPLTIADPTHPCTHHKGLYPLVEGFCISGSVATQDRLFYSRFGNKNPNRQFKSLSCIPCSHGEAPHRSQTCQGSKPTHPPASAESF